LKFQLYLALADRTITCIQVYQKAVVHIS